MNTRRFPLTLTTLSILVVLFLLPYLSGKTFYAHAQDKRTPAQRIGIQNQPQVFSNTALSDPQVTLFIGADGRFTMQTANGRLMGDLRYKRQMGDGYSIPTTRIVIHFLLFSRLVLMIKIMTIRMVRLK